MRKVAVILLGAIALLVLGLAVAIAVLDEAQPEGVRSAEADALAREMLDWTNADAWARTGAVRWNFGGRFQHLWDRERGYARVSWGPYVVLLRTETQSGIVRADGAVVRGDRAAELRKTAYGRWINDSFWLYPFDGVFDPSTRRALVETEDRGRALLVTYQDGGITPGDAYLWLFGDDGAPVAWKMWVSIIPIGGLEVSWEEWITLDTGVKISTLHRGPFELKLTDVAGAETLEALLGGQPDPFEELETNEPAPATQPANETGDPQPVPVPSP